MSYPLKREIDFDFDFDFDSSVPCVAGEAKLCVRVRRASLTLGLILGRMSPAFAAGFRALFHDRHVGFNYFYVIFMVSRGLFVVLRMGFNDSMIERQ